MDLIAEVSGHCPFHLLVVPGTILAFYGSYEQGELY